MPNKLLLSPLCGWVLRSAMLHYGPKARRYANRIEIA
jgi:hypothetical protein